MPDKSQTISSALHAEIQRFASCQGRLKIVSQARAHIPLAISTLKKLERIAEAKIVAIDSETNGLRADSRAFAYSLCDNKGNSAALRKGVQSIPCPACKGDGSGLTAKTLRVPQLWMVQECRTCRGRGVASSAAVYQWIVGRIAQNKSQVKLLHNVKFDWQRMDLDGIKLRGTIHDTMLMCYVLDSRPPHGLKELCAKLGENIDDEYEVYTWIKAARHAALMSVKRHGYYWLEGKIELNPDKIAHPHVPWDIMERYARLDVERTQLLFAYARRPIRKKAAYLKNYLLEMKLMPIVKRMEQRGIRWDMDMAYLLLGIIEKDKKTFQDNAFHHAHKEFNILSPKQLANILFGDLGATIIARTEKGNPSLSKENLVKYDHPLVTQVLRYRLAVKMDNYIRLIIKTAIKERDGWIVHPSMLQHGTVTSRFSMTNPPLQTIPAMDTGRLSNYLVNIRKCFVPRKGFLFYFLDFSQIEMKIFASLSQEPVMLNAINNGENIHARVATAVTGVKEGHKDFAHCYKLAKVVNFALIYGAGLGRVISVTRDAKGVERFYNDYHASMPGIARFMEAVSHKARRNGYVITDFGFRIPVDRNFAYKATNYLIQGTAAGVLKRAILRTTPIAERWKGFMLHTMHDEIIKEMPTDIQHDKALPEIKEAMERGWKKQFGIPLKTDIAISAQSWADEVKVKETNAKAIRGSVSEALRLRDLSRKETPDMGSLRLLR